jgi:hypothetical protein
VNCWVWCVCGKGGGVGYGDVKQNIEAELFNFSKKWQYICITVLKTVFD